MAAAADFSGRGLSREDEILARVVVDLGLAGAADIESAIAELAKLKDAGKGGDTSLGRILEKSGNLNARYLKVVQKAVKSRRSTGKTPVAPPPPEQDKGQDRQPVREPDRASGGVEQQQILPSLAMPPPPPPGAVPDDARQREIAVRDLISRAVPSRLHQQCLVAVLRGRPGAVSSAQLRQECGCNERDARRVLETWRSAGIVRQEAGEQETPRYIFAPSEADLALLREFMAMWEDPRTQGELLAWIREVEW